ncbi:MAG: hypothetical protein COV29_02210 [Candidatus Yanofskybacteria bacterium CG10_big_fil_rev_8_21_14_0_10_36_16]|uniref:Glycosyl transferase family 1 domain-containing protein n=1 Tax=Candidatus Yanofskybacteria bacterium CG10_big_fil_rev_8_21_14_0_10_36_16 TaxID=1975096 RepID=A0A2J0Q7W0_9BACT|nr:MAG: hypothetical protein COV29_02210 [Candidatus Yanofskybacteria bacterium CG10_big_fil_rev_8_21_14_0_10_36_16]
MKILVTGYPYIKESYIKTFEKYPKPEDLVFLLPRLWKAKGGKVEYRPPKNNYLKIRKTTTLFYHSNYPLIGGTLKGWMPFLPFHLALAKTKDVKMLYSALEPVLLSTLWNGIWAKIFGLKHVVFSWENIPFDEKFKGPKGFVLKLILKLNIKFVDGVVCGNKKCKEIFLGLTDKPLDVIPIAGLDEFKFKPSNASGFIKKHKLENKIVFAFAGAIGYRKGVHVALKSFAEIKKNLPDTCFIIAGSGEYEKEIDELIGDLKIKKYVIRIPWLSHEELPELLASSDIFLYPSISNKGWAEQFGYSMAEASLCELPVIATKSGSIEDVVVDEITGILVEENNQAQLAEAMLRLAKDKELKKRFGEAGRNYVINHYSNSVIAQKFYEFFGSFKF